MTGQLGFERVWDWLRFCHRQVGSRHAMPASQDLMQRGDLICITRPHLSLQEVDEAMQSVNAFSDPRERLTDYPDSARESECLSWAYPDCIANARMVFICKN